MPKRGVSKEHETATGVERQSKISKTGLMQR